MNFSKDFIKYLLNICDTAFDHPDQVQFKFNITYATLTGKEENGDILCIKVTKDFDVTREYLD